MRRSIVITGIIICVVGAFVGILFAFLFPDYLKQYVPSDFVDFLGLFSILGFISFFVGLFLSLIGAKLKRKKPKKTKVLPYSRYYDP
jgi:predicted membrane protein